MDTKNTNLVEKLADTPTFTYAKYLEACQKYDYNTLAKNHTKIDAFYFLWFGRYEKCYKIIDPFVKENSFFQFLKGIGDDDMEMFARWLAFNAYDDFISHPKNDYTKELFKQFKDRSDEADCVDCYRLYYDFITEIDDVKVDKVKLESLVEDNDDYYDHDYDKAILFYVENYLKYNFKK